MNDLADKIRELERKLDERAQIAVNAINRAEKAERALESIAVQGEGLAEMGEPQNGVPEFCRAILRGENVKLGDLT